MKLLSTTLAAAVLAISGGTAAVASPVIVNVVHGIDGRELGAAQALPVDIALNGACALKWVTFKQSALIDAEAGKTYTVSVHPADGTCSVAPVIKESLTIPDDGTTALSVVASLSARGAPQLAVFNSTAKFFGINLAQISVRNLVRSRSLSVRFKASPGRRTRLRTIRNGSAAYYFDNADGFSYTAQVFVAGRKLPLFTLDGTGSKDSVTHYNIVGSAKNGFSVVTEKFKPFKG